MDEPTRQTSLISALASPEGRHEAARKLAEHLGAEDLIVFIRDPEINVLLPAPGFVQTLPSGRAWRSLLDECAARGRSTAVLPFPDAESLKSVTATAGRGGSVLALVGGEPRPGEARDVEELLPLLAAAFRGERAVLIAEGQTRVARQAAEQSRALAETLGTTRSDLERALRAAEAASSAKDEFLATVSHELRTPLTAILGWARMLRGGQLDGPSAERALETIERNVWAQSQLIEDILDVSRVITGKLRLEVQPVELAQVIESSLNAVLPASEAKGIRLQRVLDSGASMVSGDPARLQQVMWNLLSNAIKFTPKGGRVQVRLERVNSHIELTVSDTGQGIAPEVLPHIFERFRQADSSTTRAHGGLGLGLAIVRHLIEMHGGTVEAESEGPGRGATFIVRLPLVAVRAPAAGRAGDADRVHPTAGGGGAPFDCPPELEGLRLLVVDDEEDTRTLLKAVLEQCGASVTAVSSAAEALAALTKTRPDVLISDLGMPGEDGYALIKKVRALPAAEGGQTPCAALTAYARVEDRMKVLRAGFQIHVPKPVEPAELVAVVANLAGRIATGDK